MNAAARLTQQHTFAKHLMVTHLLYPKQFLMLIFSIALLITALSVIYVTHTTRLVHAQYQQLVNEQTQLYKTHGQLLLEKSTLLMQSKVQHTAEQQLNMVFPDHQTIEIMRE